MSNEVFEVGKQITRIRDGQVFTITRVNEEAHGFSATTGYGKDVTVSCFFYKHNVNEDYIFTNDSIDLPSGHRDNVLPMQLHTRCECGSAKLGSPNHSDYCPRYERSK